jgi:two-component system chemotaxis response regulator CheB
MPTASQPDDARAADWVVALVGSAGALAAMGAIAEALPEDLPAAVVVVLHLPPGHQSMLPAILSRRTALEVKEAEEGDLLRSGCVYVAPADVHLLVRVNRSLTLDTRPPIHFVRPSADLLLESLAAAVGNRALAVILSGVGRDGADGAVAIKAAGGTVIAQSEESAAHFGMPAAAIAAGAANHVLPLDRITATVVEYVTGKREST